MDFCEPIAQNLQSIHQDWEGLEIIIDDWLSTIQTSGSFCWAAGDGVINAIGSGCNAIQLCQQIYRLLLPGSLVIFRNLLRPFPTPTTEEVFESLAAGRIRNFGTFRHQVLQSLQPSFMEGIAIRKVRDLILGRGVLNGGLGDRVSWPEEQLRILDAYACEDASFCYPTLRELRSLTRADFEELDIRYGSYEMAECSPTIVYRTRRKD
jgi:SAM-dependent methyltransferase